MKKLDKIKCYSTFNNIQKNLTQQMVFTAILCNLYGNADDGLKCIKFICEKLKD